MCLLLRFSPFAQCMSLRFIHIVAYNKIIFSSFIFTEIQYCITWICHNFYHPILWHLDLELLEQGYCDQLFFLTCIRIQISMHLGGMGLWGQGVSVWVVLNRVCFQLSSVLPHFPKVIVSVSSPSNCEFMLVHALFNTWYFRLRIFSPMIIFIPLIFS